MKRPFRRDLYLILCGVLLWLLADAARIRAAAFEALSLCGRTVIPALFPFMAVSTLLISLGFGEWLAPHLAGLMTTLFHLPGCSGSALLLGLVGGYPIGARTAAELYAAGQLTREEAERLLAFCNNSNPVFLISVLGAGVFGSARLGIWLWLIHLLSALLTGLVFRRGSRAPRRREIPQVVCKTCTLSAALVDAVRRALGGILSVCAFVVLFYVASLPLRTLDGWLRPVLVGSVELFSLTPLLSPTPAGFLTAAFCTGWGGLSVLCQTAAVLDGTALSLRTAVLGKVVQGLFSLLLAALFLAFF